MTGAATRQIPIVDALISGECLTTAALVEITGLAGREVSDACCRLVTRGWIVRRERGCFELSAAGRKAVLSGETITSGPRGPLAQQTPRRPRRRTQRDRMWTAMLVLRKFRISDLEITAGATVASAQRYVAVLEAAGYLSRLRPERGTAPTSNGFVRWLLIRPSGAQAPIYRPSRSEVYDPNTAEVFPCIESTRP
jgi:hypothetical protein